MVAGIFVDGGGEIVGVCFVFEGGSLDPSLLALSIKNPIAVLNLQNEPVHELGEVIS